MDITKVLKVVDTREVVEIDDRFVPLAGTGTMNECAACGKGHEVHVHVELKDRSQAIIGTGCLKSKTMSKLANKLAENEKTLKSLKSVEAILLKNRAIEMAVDAIVKNLPLPAIEVETIDSRRSKLTMGDATVWSNEGVTPERQECLRQIWLRNRFHDVLLEQFPDFNHKWSRQATLKTITAKIKELEKSK